MKFLIFIALTISCVVANNIILEGADFYDGVVTDALGNTNNAWIIKFFNPRCPHCRKFAPIWEDASDNLDQEGLNFGELDCSRYKPVCDRFNIWGVPTVMVFKDNYMVEYEGPNSFDGLSEYILNREYEQVEPNERAFIPPA
ncbi:unnamed protein product [Moneuplotes crassus]|uniref:Alpha-phosophoinositide-specific phospholipase C-like protein n=1 Tax=Euplotes crassus TaxID=5936 RepID=Q27142_EUPCR|nr:alpha-phosophoinositide-specific phospholipase C-like protein precursor [Moneuplotes crassus]CAI2383689.1 unnamed protein product [Moneuplotes crassus]prf//1803429A phospholipase C-like protein [Moneuplotes crassus]